ncbi:hypothetical protein SDJN03_26616, partial [Cucurbita argyrosperma subsp. sororia]
MFLFVFFFYVIPLVGYRVWTTGNFMCFGSELSGHGTRGSRLRFLRMEGGGGGGRETAVGVGRHGTRRKRWRRGNEGYKEEEGKEKKEKEKVR